VISDKGRIEVTAYLHCRLDFCNAILAETADVVIKRLISSEYCGSFSIRNNFPGPITLFYAAYTGWAFGVVQNRFQAHVQSCLYLYKLYIPVKNFGGRPWLRASAGYPMPKVQAQHPPYSLPTPTLPTPPSAPRFSRLWRSAFPFFFIYDSSTARWIEELLGLVLFSVPC